LRAAVEIAKQRKAAATDIEEPEALGGWGNNGDVFGEPVDAHKKDIEWRAGARVYVPNPFLMGPRVSARAAEVMAAQADLQAAQWLVEQDVHRLFAELNYLGEDVALAADLVRANDQILSDARSRAQRGAATAADVVAVAQRHLDAQNNLDSVRHRQELARRDLAGLLDIPSPSLRIVSNVLTHVLLPESALPADRLQTVALACRGDVVALHWRALAARSAYREARNGRIPWFKEVTAGNREPSDQWWVGVGVTVPVFSWTKNHAESVAEAQSNLANVNETNAVRVVSREIRNALDEVEERRRVQLRNQNEVVPLIAEMGQTLQVLKGAPNLMVSQVAATEAQILESSRLELAARWQYQLALLNLERLLGKPLSETLSGIM
jgi:outer membrane protein TolC